MLDGKIIVREYSSSITMAFSSYAHIDIHDSVTIDLISEGYVPISVYGKGGSNAVLHSLRFSTNSNKYVDLLINTTEYNLPSGVPIIVYAKV